MACECFSLAFFKNDLQEGITSGLILKNKATLIPSTRRSPTVSKYRPKICSTCIPDPVQEAQQSESSYWPKIIYFADHGGSNTQVALQVGKAHRLQ